MIFNINDRLKDLYYNNKKSNLKASNPQDAVDELSGKVDQIASNQIPDEYLKKSVDEYVNENSGGFATHTDISQLSSEIAELKGDLVNIAPTKKEVFTLDDTTIFSNVYSGGYYDGGGTFREGSGYDNYKLNPVDYDYSIYATSNGYLSLCVFNGDVETRNFIARYRVDDNNMPSESNPLTITKGQTVVFTKNSGCTEFFIYNTWRNRVKFGVDYREELEDTISKVIPKKRYLKYINGSGVGSSTERVEVYVPTIVGYIKYNLVHTIVSSINANCWRIHNAISCNDLLEEKTTLTTSGEWECAIKISGASDFSGGLAHGDEVMTSVLFILNKKIVDVTTLSDLTEFDEFEMVETSNLYNPSDSTTVIAQHGSKHIFNDKLRIKQSLEWKMDVVTSSCYLGMFPPAKNVTNVFYCNSDYAITALNDKQGYSLQKKKATEMTIYSEEVGFYADFAVPVYPTGYNNADYLLITDNSTPNYNKCYYVICSNDTNQIASGTRWISETVYTLNMVK